MSAGNITQSTWQNAWASYKKTHILAQYRRKDQTFLLSGWLKNISGTTVSVDSFYPADVCYEFDSAKAFCNKLKLQPNFVSTLYDIHINGTYDNIIAVGQQWVRYCTVPECVQHINYLSQLSHKNIFLCLPIRTLQYHRLRYSRQQIIDQILDCCKLDLIDKVNDLPYNNIYLWTQVKI